ncbi:hypothetical protein [Pseudomonas phage Itty13]|uniref:Tail fiber protein n=1 Tax=Pseudomonas phage Itty13 TaxID=2805750 RepID=A0A889IQZ1_9CAUD|nr:tail protein [Pseudomonas phage Itty13]QRE00589.1 hypothetical protein [Pseudomonas phage Itty13]
MAVLLKNNATSRLASSISAAATSFAVSAGDGGKFPFPPAGQGQWYPVTVIDSAGNMEVMRCTARSGDVLTVARGQEGTTARAFNAGDRVELRITAAAMLEFQQTSDISAYMQGMLGDPDAASARNRLQLQDGAISQKQATALDNATGRLMTVGAFGLGKMLDLRGTVLESGTPTDVFGKGMVAGFARGGSDGLNIPAVAGTNQYGVLIVNGQWSDTSGGHGAAQRMFIRNGNLFFQVQSNATTWGPWSQAFSDVNLTITDFARTILDDANAAAVRQTLELGSAAQWDAQASVGDTALNRLLRMGAFGLGGVMIGPSVGIGQSNPTGFYYRSGEPGGHFFLDVRLSSTTAGFRLSNLPYQDRFFLHAAAGANSIGLRSPVEIYHTGNMPTLTAGNGLTGGGALNADRTLTLGTPGTISTGTGNSVTATSHTHALSLTTADVTSLTADAGIGAIGTYAYLFNSSGPNVGAGGTTSGANLRWTSHNAVSGGAPSGTWRCMGNGNTGGATVWLRIS